jgi:hypothetical protein
MNTTTKTRTQIIIDALHARGIVPLDVFLEDDGADEITFAKNATIYVKRTGSAYVHVNDGGVGTFSPERRVPSELGALLADVIAATAAI